MNKEILDGVHLRVAFISFKYLDEIFFQSEAFELADDVSCNAANLWITNLERVLAVELVVKLLVETLQAECHEAKFRVCWSNLIEGDSSKRYFG